MSETDPTLLGPQITLPIGHSWVYIIESFWTRL
jgi:hypothetical protein